VYICCIWSTLNSGRLHQNLNNSELIYKFTNTKMQRCHHKQANTKRPISYTTPQNLGSYQNFSVNNKFNSHSLLHSCDSQAQVRQNPTTESCNNLSKTHNIHLVADNTVTLYSKKLNYPTLLTQYALPKTIKNEQH
jgi:hypothetical protein